MTTCYVLTEEDIQLTEKSAVQRGLHRGSGEAGREPRTGAGLCEQRRPEEDTQGMSTVVTKSG